MNSSENIEAAFVRLVEFVDIVIVKKVGVNILFIDIYFGYSFFILMTYDTVLCILLLK